MAEWMQLRNLEANAGPGRPGPEAGLALPALRDDLPMADWQRSRDWQVCGGALAPDSPAMLQISQRSSPFRDGGESGWPNGQQGPEVVGRAIAGAAKAVGDAARGLWDALPPLRRNRNDMVDANHVGADKYFHCKGNCEAAQRGANAENGAAAPQRLAGGVRRPQRRSTGRQCG